MNRPTITFQNVARDWKSNPCVPIITIEQLRTLLGSLLKNEPGIVNFESSTRNLLQLGIGGQLACAQFTTNDDNPRYLSAKAKILRATDHVEFDCGGTPTPIPPELCIHFDEAVGVAEHFFKTGGRDPNFEWVEI